MTSMSEADRTNIIFSIGAACGFLEKIVQGDFSETSNVERAREISQALQNSLSLLGREWYSVEDTSLSIKRVLEV